MADTERDNLIENVKYGRMTPAEAEIEANRLGLDPLACSPELKKFDPQEETWWTLAMTVAWIAWRDINEVVICSDKYRGDCWEWHYREWRVGPDGPIHKGHFLEQARPVTLSLLEFSETYDSATDSMRDSSIKIENAIGRLWKALQDNALEATGIPTDGGGREQIPDFQWRDLRPFEENGKDVVRYDPLSASGYNDVVFRSRSITNLWPDFLPKRSLQLPPTVKPEGAGYFPLYCAAQWIATEGGVRHFSPVDPEIWPAAYSELTSHIASGQVHVTGIRNGIREKLEGYIFASLRVDHPFLDTPIELLFSEEVYLSSYPYVDETHWREGFDDSLRTGAALHWSKLMVLKPDVARCWPFSDARPDFRTGAPGRPTPMHLVAAEHARRLGNREAAASVSVESKQLAAWLRQMHPALPALTAKAIENKIRAAHRQANPPK